MAVCFPTCLEPFLGVGPGEHPEQLDVAVHPQCLNVHWLGAGFHRRPSGKGFCFALPLELLHTDLGQVGYAQYDFESNVPAQSFQATAGG